MFQDSRWFLLGIAVPYQTMKNVPSGSEVATNQISELESFNQKTCEKNWVTGSKPKHWSSLVFWWILYHTLGCQDSSDPWRAGRFWSFFPAQEQWKAGRDPGFDPKFFTVVEVVVFFFVAWHFLNFMPILGRPSSFDSISCVVEIWTNNQRTLGCPVFAFPICDLWLKLHIWFPTFSTKSSLAAGGRTPQHPLGRHDFCSLFPYLSVRRLWMILQGYIYPFLGVFAMWPLGHR